MIRNTLFFLVLMLFGQVVFGQPGQLPEPTNLEVTTTGEASPGITVTLEQPGQRTSTITFSREDFNNPLVEIQTSMGVIILELFPEEAPQTVENFLGLADGTKPWTNPVTGVVETRPFYDGLVFHRVIAGFMIQGGSPTGLGDGTPGFSFRDEINARSLGLDKMQVVDDEGAPHPLLGIDSQEDFQQLILAPLYDKLGITSQEQLIARRDEVNRIVRGMNLKDSYENLGYQ
jgi:peptidyl-prolyl cis-trans isomerase A (cyclophilin A)